MFCDIDLKRDTHIPFFSGNQPFCHLVCFNVHMSEEGTLKCYAWFRVWADGMWFLCLVHRLVKCTVYMLIELLAILIATLPVIITRRFFSM